MLCLKTGAVQSNTTGISIPSVKSAFSLNRRRELFRVSRRNGVHKSSPFMS
jgi:hypothetical protein